MAFRHNWLVASALLVLCVLVLYDARGHGGTRQSASQTSQQRSSPAPTYYRDVLPIIREHCVACHREGGVAPMSFETYEAVRRYAYLIRNVTEDKAMPPPFSIPLVGQVTNDPSLTVAQICTLGAWANFSAPAGDPHDAPATHASAPWSISKPDLIIRMQQPVSIPAAGNPDYVYQIVPTRFTEGHWIQMAEVLPSRRENLLQMMVVIRRPGSRWLRHARAGALFTSSELINKRDLRWADDDILMVYAPGSSTQEFPGTMGKFVPAGSDLVFRAQYVTNGVAGFDQSSVGVIFSQQPPSHRVITLLLGDDREFTIPPNASDYRMEARGVLRRDVVLVSLFPQLHLRGKRFEYDWIPTGGARDDHSSQGETLLRVNYDLRWQTNYRLSEPRILTAGSELRAIAWYDNSPSNPHNPNPNATVHSGDQPRDEVLGGFFDIAVPATLGKTKILVHSR